MKRKKVKYKIPLYHGELIIIQDKDLGWLEKKYNLNLHGMDACVLSDHTKEGYSRYVMAFSGKTHAKIIAHEAIHVVNNVFHDRSIKPDLLNDEPQAYLLGWVVEKCHKFLKVKK